LIRELASSEGSAEKIVARNRAAALRRSSARRRVEGEEISRGRGMGRVQLVDEDEDEMVPFDPLDGEGEESSLYRVRQHYDDPYVPRKTCVDLDGWIQFVMIRSILLGDSPCTIYINEVYLKHMPDWAAYYQKN